ncbi:hypothetical protein GOP47_0006543 [Adiantum capillus-veneris]|uniref:DUF4005 domain-containing protein n=1 Tax=Adiantum capillus-veneris TaxID=13818 RepID=A0A9D4V3V6_ADICA|nr:hypothetical protein GOP47_0006543 [Adiantum capillus-veneris]
MGKRGTWLSAVKKAFSSSKDPAEEQQHHKDPSSKYLFSKDGRKESVVIQEKRSFKERNRWSFRRSSRTLQPADQLHLQPGNDLNHHEELQNRGRQTEDATYLSSNGHFGFENGYTHNHSQNKQALAVAVATAAAADAAVAAAQAAAQVVKLTGTGRSGCNSNNTTPHLSIIARRSQEELAAIRIQAAFRAYLARRTLRTLKGLARLQALAQGRVGQRQTSATMRCMQALVRAQAAVRGRRTTRLCDDTDALGETTVLHPTWEPNKNHLSADIPTHMNEKGDQNKDVHNGQLGPGWDDSTQTIEQIQARELSRQDAAVKRERAMAYAFSHQQLHTSSHFSSKMSTPPQLGWNWLERWMAARPWENRRPSPAKEAPVRASAASSTPISSIPQRHPSPLRRASAPTTPAPSSRQPGTSRTASPARRTAAVTPILGSFSAPATRLSSNPFSMSSRAHSLASSSMRDDLSVASFSGTPSYMASTESARAKLRSHSTPKQRAGGVRSAATSVHSEEMGAHQLQPASRKRLSFANVDSGSARNFLSWRGSASLQRNHSFEGYSSKHKF